MTFRLFTASRSSSGVEVDWSCGTIYIMMVGCDWYISICYVLARSCSLRRPLLYHSPAVFLDRWHPRFRNFNSIRVKSYVDSFLDPMCVPLRVSFNKLNFLGWENLSIRRAKQKANLMYKCTNNLAPAYLCNLFTPRTVYSYTANTCM